LAACNARVSGAWTGAGDERRSRRPIHAPLSLPRDDGGPTRPARPRAYLRDRRSTPTAASGSRDDMLRCSEVDRLGAPHGGGRRRDGPLQHGVNNATAGFSMGWSALTRRGTSTVRPEHGSGGGHKAHDICRPADATRPHAW